MAHVFDKHCIQEEEIKAIQPLENKFYNKVHHITDVFAATRIGQFAIAQSDRLLRILETTAKWSLPQEKQSTELQRPVSWPIFLWLIVVLRISRFWLSIAAMLIGNNPITPQDMVFFIQTRRRKMRAIRLQGIRTISERQTQENGKTNLLSKMSKMLLSAVCLKGNYTKTDHNMMMLRQHWCNQSPSAAVDNKPHTSSKRACDNEEDPADVKKDKYMENDMHLSFDEKLAKYADMPSEDDSDFLPPAEDSSNDDDETDDEETSSCDSSAASAVADVNENEATIFASVLLDELNRLKELDGNDQMEMVEKDNQMSMNGEEEYKMTPGHITAAVTEIKQSGLLNNSAAVVTDLGEHDSKHTFDSFSPNTLNLPTHNSTYSATFAGTPVATETSLSTFESPTMGSASSSEDIFYSPIGSPTLVDKMSVSFFSQQQNHQIVVPAIAIQCATPAKPIENDENIEPRNVEVITQNPVKEIKEQQKSHQKHPTYPKQQSTNIQNHQSQNQRYRGRNRRKFDAIP